MKNKIDIQNEYQIFLNTLKQAAKLGLELENTEKNEIKKSQGELGVWAVTYNILDSNGYGQSHGLFNAYTKKQATGLGKLIDISIFDTNKKRKTVIEKEFELYDLEKLKRYIQIRKQEQK